MEAHYVAQLKELNDAKLFRSAYMLVRRDIASVPRFID